MNLADRLTFFRIILAPLFFVVYLLPAQLTGNAAWIIPLLWVIFAVSELTDMLDGMAARHLKQTSDFAKLSDPFADTHMQMTFFLCFVVDGIFPAVLFLIVLYREFGILFIRNLMLKKGIAMGARISGKIKTVSYIAAVTAALLYASLNRLGVFEPVQPLIKTIAIIVFSVSVLFSLLSFFDYIRVYSASVRSEKGNPPQIDKMEA
jgi:CDP-diacylglycerol--glycerol-3-phosphate 3-phosphatidyltransferase